MATAVTSNTQKRCEIRGILHLEKLYKEYVASVCKELDNNWTPPASGRKTQAILIVTIGSDGSLYEYHFAKSSGDEATDRSIVSAVKQTVPFPKFGSMNKNVKNFNFQFVFNYGIFKKSVI